MKDPVTATLPAADPEIIPSKVLKSTAVFADAARSPCVIELDSLKKKSPAPNSDKNDPKIVNSTIYVDATPSGMP